jgi:hypothetical protein
MRTAAGNATSPGINFIVWLVRGRVIFKKSGLFLGPRQDSRRRQRDHPSGSSGKWLCFGFVKSMAGECCTERRSHIGFFQQVPGNNVSKVTVCGTVSSAFFIANVAEQKDHPRSKQVLFCVLKQKARGSSRFVHSMCLKIMCLKTLCLKTTTVFYDRAFRTASSATTTTSLLPTAKPTPTTAAWLLRYGHLGLNLKRWLNVSLARP